MNDALTYYNEHDKNAAEWLRNLCKAREITNGTVDERDIQTVMPDELAGMRRVHFFAGIGGWDLALRLAGWPTDREVWTGSCPCQPYSSAGKGAGQKDPRHLWPDMFRLVKECRPDTIFGEQVAAAIRHGWLDGVFADLEGIGYACGAVVVGAHSVGAPHIRQRLYWCASRLPDSKRDQEHQEQRESDAAERERGSIVPGGCGTSMPGRLAQDPAGERRGRRDDGDKAGDDGQVQVAGLGADSGLHNAIGSRLEEHGIRELGREIQGTEQGREAGGVGDGDEQGLQGRSVSGRECYGKQTSGPGVYVGPWSDYRIIPCTDGKARRTGSRVFPLVNAWPRDGRDMGESGSRLRRMVRDASRSRVGMLKGSGNAIVPALAAES